MLSADISELVTLNNSFHLRLRNHSVLLLDANHLLFLPGTEQPFLCCPSGSLLTHTHTYTHTLDYAGSNQSFPVSFNLLNPTGHVMHQQFNIQQPYVLPTLYLCVLYLSENKQRLVPLTA